MGLTERDGILSTMTRQFSPALHGQSSMGVSNGTTKRSRERSIRRKMTLPTSRLPHPKQNPNPRNARTYPRSTASPFSDGGLVTTSIQQRAVGIPRGCPRERRGQQRTKDDSFHGSS